MAIQDAALQRLLSGQIDQGIYNQQANAITNKVTDNYNTSVAPGMASGAMASGAYGGSRQGIAQGLAASRLNSDISNQLAGLSGSMYNTAQNLMGTTANNLQSLDTQKLMQQRALEQDWQKALLGDATTRYGIDNQRDLGWGNINLNRDLGFAGLDLQRELGLGGLANNAYANETTRMGTLGGLNNQQYANETSRGLGLGNLGLNYAQLDQQNNQWNNEFNRQIYNDAYGQNMNNLQVGVNLLGTMNGYNQQDLGLGTTVRNAPLDYLTQFTNLNSTIGRGGQTTTTTAQGGGVNYGAAALGGAQLGRAASDWWGGSGNNIVSTPATGFSNYDGNGGGWNAWSNFGSGAD